jgi:hypothetical protein
VLRPLDRPRPQAWQTVRWASTAGRTPIELKRQGLFAGCTPRHTRRFNRSGSDARSIQPIFSRSIEKRTRKAFRQISKNGMDRHPVGRPVRPIRRHADKQYGSTREANLAAERKPDGQGVALGASTAGCLSFEGIAGNHSAQRSITRKVRFETKAPRRPWPGADPCGRYLSFLQDRREDQISRYRAWLTGYLTGVNRRRQQE